jgi:hypothetical protein
VQIKLSAVLALLAVAALSPAPIVDSSPGNRIPTHTEAQREQQQSLNGAYPVVGEVPVNTDPLVIHGEPSEPQAAAAVAVATEAEQRAAQLALANAEQKLQQQAPGRGALWIYFAIGAAVVGVLVFAGKAMRRGPSAPVVVGETPTMDPVQKKRW